MLWNEQKCGFVAFEIHQRKLVLIFGFKSWYTWQLRMTTNVLSERTPGSGRANKTNKRFGHKGYVLRCHHPHCSSGVACLRGWHIQRSHQAWTEPLGTPILLGAFFKQRSKNKSVCPEQSCFKTSWDHTCGKCGKQIHSLLKRSISTWCTDSRHGLRSVKIWCTYTCADLLSRHLSPTPTFCGAWSGGVRDLGTYSFEAQIWECDTEPLQNRSPFLGILFFSPVALFCVFLFWKKKPTLQDSHLPNATPELRPRIVRETGHTQKKNWEWPIAGNDCGQGGKTDANEMQRVFSSLILEQHTHKEANKHVCIHARYSHRRHLFTAWKTLISNSVCESYSWISPSCCLHNIHLRHEQEYTFPRTGQSSQLEHSKPQALSGVAGMLRSSQLIQLRVS